MNESDSLLALDPSSDGWIALVSSNAEATIFHHPAWSGLLARCYGFRPFVSAVCDVSGAIQAALPMMRIGRGRPERWVSLPFTDHCSPLHLGSDSKQRLADSLAELSRDSNGPTIELRCNLLDDQQVDTDPKHVLHTIRLSSDIDTVFNRVSSMHRRNIRTALKRGVIVERGSGPEHLEEFYRLHVQSRRRQGVPVQPKRFFDLLGRDLLQKGLGFVLLAHHDGECLAAAVFLHWNDTLMYKYGASSTAELSLRPNNLLFWEAIRWGCEHGYGHLDLGRTDVSNTGLRAFKSGWGADEVVLAYSSSHPNRPNPLLDGATHAAGVVIRHSPEWVCRTAGELLYKHFA